jgi:hypothetical protein
LKIHLHIGSIAVRATPDRAANRGFLIDPKGHPGRALRQDSHVRRRTGGGESYRESATYQPGEAP